MGRGAPCRGSRRRDVTPAPGTVGVNLDRIRPRVFANSIAPRLGIDMPRVMSGTYASATITTSQGASPKAKSAAIAATAGALTVTTATPKRISARLELSIEDIAAVGQENFESILRENLSLALSDALDNQIVNGDRPDSPSGDQVAQLEGVFSRLTDPTAPSAVADFDAFAASKHAARRRWALGQHDQRRVNRVRSRDVSTSQSFEDFPERDQLQRRDERGRLRDGESGQRFGGFWTI